MEQNNEAASSPLTFPLIFSHKSVCLKTLHPQTPHFYKVGMYFHYKTSVSSKNFQMILNVDSESKGTFELWMKHDGRDHKSTAVTKHGRAPSDTDTEWVENITKDENYRHKSGHWPQMREDLKGSFPVSQLSAESVSSLVYWKEGPPSPAGLLPCSFSFTQKKKCHQRQDWVIVLTTEERDLKHQYLSISHSKKKTFSHTACVKCQSF